MYQNQMLKLTKLTHDCYLTCKSNWDEDIFIHLLHKFDEMNVNESFKFWHINVNYTKLSLASAGCIYNMHLNISLPVTFLTVQNYKEPDMNLNAMMVHPFW